MRREADMKLLTTPYSASEDAVGIVQITESWIRMFICHLTIESLIHYVKKI